MKPDVRTVIIRVTYIFSFLMALGIFTVYRFWWYPLLNRIYQDSDYLFNTYWLIIGTFYLPIIFMSSLIIYRIIIHFQKAIWSLSLVYDAIELIVGITVLFAAFSFDPAKKRYSTEMVFICVEVSNLFVDFWKKRLQKKSIKLDNHKTVDMVQE